MEEEALCITVEPPPPVDGETLAALKSKLSGKRDEQASHSSSSSKRQCPRVPKKLLQDVEGEDYNVPKLISLGPYHYGRVDLEGETLKLKLAAALIYACDLVVDEIYNSILYRVRELKDCYDVEAAERFSDAKFTEMMLVDGCALLWFILSVCVDHGHANYDIRYQDLSLLHQDALLLENQLPYQLLQELMKLMDPLSDNWTPIFRKFFCMMEKSYFPQIFGIKGKPFLQRMKDYRCPPSRPVIGCIEGNPEPQPGEQSKPCHLLDLYRRNFLGDDEPSNPTPTETRNSTNGSYEKDKISVGDVKEQVMASFRNVKELMAAGIRIKPSPTPYLRDISFTSYGITACLRLPPITIDKSTKTLFFNLIAYEMSSDVPHDFISYLRFLDSLIDHADDVKELQSAGVLQNNLGTHEEVAEFFNTVSAKLDPNFRAYKDVKVKIRKHLKSHYNSKLKMWMTQCLDTHFGSPWTIIAWTGATLALFFTAVQTYFSAFKR